MKYGDRKVCPLANVPHATGNSYVVPGLNPLAREPLTALVTLQHSSWGHINHASFNRPNDIPPLNSLVCLKPFKCYIRRE